jgi:hypothetical protein
MMRFHGTMDDREPKSAASALGCHEWLEQPIFDGIRNSPPLVGHAKHYAPAQEVLGLRG